jgi:hypothetical protein
MCCSPLPTKGASNRGGTLLSRSLCSFLAICLLATASTASAQTNEIGQAHFVRAKLSGNISLDVPTGWRYLGADKTNVLETYAESVLDLTKIPHGPTGVVLDISAPSDVGYLSITVVLEYRTVATQQQVEHITKPQLAEVDRQNRKDIESGTPLNGLKILSWEGTTVEQINGYWAMVKRYVYTLPGEAPRQMENCEFFLGNRIVSLLLQNGQKTLVPPKPIFERVKSSITFN